MAKFQYGINDQQASVQIEPASDGYRVTIGDRSYYVALRESANHSLSFTVDGKYHQVYMAAGDVANQRRLCSDGQQWTVETVDPKQKRQRGGSDSASGELTASMPGQVLKVLVAEGDLVSKGQPLVILEAMKMEMRLSATVDGAVTAINCQVGDVVKRGQSLVAIQNQ